MNRRWWPLLAATLALTGCGGGGVAPVVEEPEPAVDGRTGAVGEPVPVTVEGERTVLFEGAEGLLILASLSDSRGSAVVQLNGGGPLLPALPKNGSARARRDGLIEVAPFAFRPDRQELGSTREFSMSGVGFGRTITATLRRVGQRALVYVDDETPADAFAEADLDDLTARFDEDLYPLATGLCGEPWDVDGNGRVLLLFSPLMNQRGYGAFYPGDLSSLSANHADLLYVRVPLPAQGEPYALMRGALLATLVHELQHLLNYSRKVQGQGLGSADESWLNEAQSFLIEDLAGFLDTPGGSIENVAFFYNSPERYTLLERTGDYDDGHAGAGYLFLRYLIDRFGHDLVGRLTNSSLRGRANVTAATGVEFDELVLDWAAALWLDDRDLTDDPRYRLPGFASHATYVTGALAGPLATVVDAAGPPAAEVHLARGGVRFLRLTNLPTAGLRLTLAADPSHRLRALLLRLPASG